MTNESKAEMEGLAAYVTEFSMKEFLEAGLAKESLEFLRSI